MRNKNICRSIISIFLIIMLFSLGISYGIEDFEDRSDSAMTEFMKDALILTGTDMEVFEIENPKPREKAIMESAAYLEEYLSGKYPAAEFRLTAFIRRGLNQAYDEIRVEPVGEPWNVFVARVYKEDDQLFCTDGYYGKIKTAEYEELLEGKLASVNENIQVISTIEYQFSEKYGSDVPLVTALEETGFFAYTWVLMPYEGENMADQAQRMRGIIEESGFYGDYAIYGMLNQDMVQISKDEAFGLIPAHTDAKPVYAEVHRFIYR